MNTRREYKFIVGSTATDSPAPDDVLAALNREAVVFGSATAWVGRGLWQGAYENVIIALVALAPEHETQALMIACRLARRFKQDAVYVSGPNGDAWIAP